MQDFDAIDHIEDALSATARGLGPFVTARFLQLLPELNNWTDILAQKDRQAGRRVDRYNSRDLSLMLRVITERLGSLGYPFSDLLTRQAINCASELRTVRNRWAHSEEFSIAETFRALDSAEILLRAVHADDEAEQVSHRKKIVLSTMTTSADVMAESSSATPTPAASHTAPATEHATQPERDAEPSDDSDSPAQLSISALPVLSYAHAHNAIPVVTQIVVDHRGAELRGASLEVEVTSQVGALGDPRVLLLDLDGVSATVLRNVDLLLNPARMFTVDSPMSGAVIATLRDPDDAVITIARSEVQILAANQWQAVPQQLSLELLTTFVQPNSLAVPTLLLEASDRLGRATGSTALDGYQQQSRDRVDAIVTAVYDAMAARDIRYAEPPASWGMSGQKVRTPAEVLEGRLGTCLDTTLTMAAVLEEAGINSTLWLLEGHIFLGYWRDDASLDAPAQLDVAEAVNYVGLGQIGLVETTKLTGGDSARPFSEASRHPHNAGHVSHPDLFIGIADVRQARNARIFPLPSRSIAGDGEVVIHEYQVSAAAHALTYSPDADATVAATGRSVPPRVSAWKNALLDLSLRNRLINYTASSGFSLSVPQPALPQFEDLINEGAAITLIPGDRIPTVEVNRGIRYGRDLPESARAEQLTERKAVFIDVSEAAYTRQLQSLAYKARTIEEETGANNLYIAFGMLRWRFGDRELSSPLILVPVKLEASGRGSTYRLRIDEAGESTPNYCLLEKLRVTFGLEIPGLANPARDEAGINLPAAFAATRRGLAEARLSFTVDDTADLSILQFGKFRLWKDLDENWEVLSVNPLVGHLIHTPTHSFADPIAPSDDVDLDVLGNAVPVPADSSQLDAVAEAVTGRTFVLEGPPGTGKSQTITNILAHALANGRRVLFVAEKRAALDVVKDRLDAVGLGPFSLDLHDKGARPNAVRAQIRQAFDAMSKPDGALLKAQYELASSSQGSLRRYAERLHEPNAAGLSLYAARERLLTFPEDVPAMEVPNALVTSRSEDQLEALRSSLRSLPETADIARPARLHGWGFVEVTPKHPVEPHRLHASARAFDQALAAALARGADLETLRIARSAQFLELWAQLAGAPRYPLEAIDHFRARNLSGEVPQFQQRLESLLANPPHWFSTVAPEALTRDVHSIHSAALAADASGMFGRRRRRREALALFGNALRITPKQIPAKTISTITADVSNTANAVADLRNALATLPISTVSADWNPFVGNAARTTTDAIAWAGWLSEALARSGHETETGALRAFYRSSATNTELGNALRSLAHAWKELESHAGISVSQVPGRLAAWAGEHSVLEAWGMTRASRSLDTEEPITLQRWVAFMRALKPLRTLGLSAAADALATGEIPAEVAVMAFDKGAAIASIQERSVSQGLENFDVLAHERTIDRFTTSTSAIRGELPRWIPAEIIAKRRFDVEYTGGRLGELKRQLSRQRGGMSVRALFTNYSDIITQIAPCVLMSPESVARFFPAQAAMFDVVVFDEASQIRVADAVGAMGRAKSVVVVGDSKQMPPTSFAEVSVDADADANASQDIVQDEESILTECVQAQIPRKWLSWHYRSQDEALISFSNHKYYESRLASFPAPWPQVEDGSDTDHGISLVRVNGQFIRSGGGKQLRTNPVEARAIVDEVARRFARSSDVAPSLGIITFNAPQRALIEALLREAPDDRIATALDQRDGLFVKNLENVQGDERDVILFSVAFSANQRGVIPLNFGPLSRAGGERRLNVAITRARRQVILFSSFDPSELRAEETTSVGIKHLRGYLELASSGVSGMGDEISRERTFDRHREEIADELRKRGYSVQTDVGLSDFRIDLSIGSAADPAQPVLALLLDGEGWRARRTVADRDGLPVAVLGNLMGWPGVDRVWLPEWLQDRDSTIERIELAAEKAEDALEDRVLDQASQDRQIDRAVALDGDLDDPSDAGAVAFLLRADPATERVPVSVHGTSASTRPTDSGPRHPRLRPFTEWVPRPVGTTDTLDKLPSLAAAQSVRTLIQEIVAAEGPIHKIRLAKLVAGAFGLTKVHAVRADAILRCVPQELKRTGDPATLWPAQMDAVRWYEARRSEPGDGRNIEHVPLNEIVNAMAIVAEVSGGMSREELKRECLGIFGGKRLTDGISGRLEESLILGLASGRLTLRPDGTYVANTD